MEMRNMEYRQTDAQHFKYFGRYEILFRVGKNRKIGIHIFVTERKKGRYVFVFEMDFDCSSCRAAEDAC